MKPLDCDVAIVGSGFGGSLLALVLQRAGRRVALIDRGHHPRFAIGESSTPAADLVLRDLAARYDLPRLAPMTRYGSWCRAYPDVIRGPKRGFSYFGHQAGTPFTPDPAHGNELLVAASVDEERADTHWLRSSVDHFLVDEVTRSGIPFLDRTDVSPVGVGQGWRLEGRRGPEAVTVTARFLVDATGEGGLLAGRLGLEAGSSPMRTRSRALFGHFTGVTPWRDRLAESGARLEDHPFPCDQAALHHVFDGGWMWQLRFDNGVTSAGFALHLDRHPVDPAASPDQEWRIRLGRLPEVARQFQDARLVAPEGGLRRTGRLQRHLRPAAGPAWALLPHAAGFVDPLHSTGIAHSLCGIERLAAILEEHWGRPSLEGELARYAATVSTELELVDELVEGCYRAMGRFPLFRAFSMAYFAATSTWEAARMRGDLGPKAALLRADEAGIRSMVRQARAALERRLADAPGGDGSFEAEMAEVIAPFNRVGLADPAARHLYRHTAPW